MRVKLHQQEYSVNNTAKKTEKKHVCIEKTKRVYPSFGIMKQPSDGALVHHMLLKIIL